MPLSSAEILNLATAPAAGRMGRIAAARRFGPQRQQPFGGAVGVMGADRELQQFLNDLAELTPNQGGPQHVHPASAPKATSDPNVSALTPSDLIWLQRIPREPAQVSYDDAVQVARLANSISMVTNASDARLVQSIWGPVKLHHDRLAAKADLEAARVPLPTVPASVVGALAAALKAELPQHDDREIMARAEDTLTQTLTNREAERTQRIARAEAAVQAVEADARRSAETVRSA